MASLQTSRGSAIVELWQFMHSRGQVCDVRLHGDAQRRTGDAYQLAEARLIAAAADARNAHDPEVNAHVANARRHRTRIGRAARMSAPLYERTVSIVGL